MKMKILILTLATSLTALAKDIPLSSAKSITPTEVDQAIEKCLFQSLNSVQKQIWPDLNLKSLQLTTLNSLSLPECAPIGYTFYKKGYKEIGNACPSAESQRGGHFFNKQFELKRANGVRLMTGGVNGYDTWVISFEPSGVPVDSRSRTQVLLKASFPALGFSKIESHDTHDRWGKLTSRSHTVKGLFVRLLPGAEERIHFTNYYTGKRVGISIPSSSVVSCLKSAVN